MLLNNPYFFSVGGIVVLLLMVFTMVFSIMNLIFLDKSWDDYIYWQQFDNKNIKQINELIKDIKREPFSGIGKPESLKYNLIGFWSRRITDEHRLVYRVIDKGLEIASCQYHY